MALEQITLPTIPSGTLTQTPVDGETHRTIHNLMHDQLPQVIDAVGIPPSAGDSLPYVRLHDGTSKGLFVPASALGPSPIVINGNYDHWQRTGGTAHTATTTFDVLTSFGPDRMFTRPAGASVTVQRSVTVPDARSEFSCLITGASSVTTVDHGTRIRAAIVKRWCKQSLLVHARFRNVSGSAYTPNLRVGTPASADDFTTVTNRLDQALQSCADSAWTHVYAIFDPTAYTNIDNGLEIALRIPSGSSVAGDTNYVAQFDVRPWASLAALPPYIPPDPDEDLLKALRYTRVFGGETTVDPVGSGLANSTTAARAFTPLTPPMRVAPTLGVSAASDWAVVDGSATNVALTNLSLNTATTQGVNFTCTVASGLTAGQGTILRAASTANARLYLHAELT